MPRLGYNHNEPHGRTMPFYLFDWTPEIIEYLAEHDVTPEDFQNAVCHPLETDVSRSSRRPCCKGRALDGRLLFCVYQFSNDVTIEPVTAYEINE